MKDETESTAMIAMQGPKVIDLISSFSSQIPQLKRYRFVEKNLIFAKFLISRTGYTGVDGVEVILPAKMAGQAVDMLMKNIGADGGVVKPAGLGARDSLRLEAGMPLYGHELSETIDPLTAGLAWAVDLGGKDFIGAEALRERIGKGLPRRLVGLELEGRRIARQGAPVKKGGRVVGEVTSGTFSPTLQKSIAMAIIDPAIAEGAEVVADLKGTENPAKVVRLPFYKRAAK